MADHGVICSMSRSGNVWDNAAMESFFSSLKTERTARKVYRTRDEAKADVFDYIECFYNPKRRHSTIGYLSPMEFERQAGLLKAGIIQTGCRPSCYLQPKKMVWGWGSLSAVRSSRTTTGRFGCRQAPREARYSTSNCRQQLAKT